MPLPLPTFTRYALVVLGLVVLSLFLWKIAPVLMLFFAGVVLATALRVLSTPLARRFKLPDTLAVAAVFVAMIGIIGVGSYFFGKQIAAQAEELMTALNEAWQKVEAYLDANALGAKVLENIKGTIDPEAMARAVKGTVTVFGGIADLVLVLFLTMYLAVDPKTYRNGFLLLLPRSVRGDVGVALDASGDALRKWLAGQLSAMVVVGILIGVGLWAVGVPLALPLGILSALLEFVPFIGPLLAAIPGLLIAFSQGPETALYAALVYLAVQFTEGNIVLPLAQKWAVSLPPVLSLLSIVAFGLLFGLLGVIFAMPLTVVAVVLTQRLYVDKLDG
jgi:predicted PurR-regulated permease PerM